MKRRRGSIILVVAALVTLVTIVGVASMALDAERRIFSMVKNRQVIYEQAAHQFLIRTGERKKNEYRTY